SEPTSGCSTCRTHRRRPMPAASPEGSSTPKTATWWRRSCKKVSSASSRERTMTKRARAGLLLIVILLAALFLVIRLKKNNDSLPIGAPAPPSSVPPTASDLSQLQLRLDPVASLPNPTDLAIRAGDTSLYVTEQEGRVRRIRRSGGDFTLDDQPVLDIT